MGALVAPLPVVLGGIGAGTEAGGTADIIGLMLALGRGNLAVARLYEAHVNAVRLMVRYRCARRRWWRMFKRGGCSGFG